MENYQDFFSGKTKSLDEMTPVENDKTFTKDAKNAQDLNNFFLNTVKNQKISECEELTPSLKNYDIR